MAGHSTLNVYKGQDSMKKFFDPEYQPPLPLVELPNNLNPFQNDGVRIYAKLMTALPCQNVKALPALNMLEKAGPLTKTIVEPSSGSTVTSLALISRVLGSSSDVYAYVSNKTDESRLRTLQFFGLKVVLYGGPAQPEISDPRGQVQKLRQMAEDNEEIFNPGQYENINNPDAHVRWTGPQLLKQLPEINIFCTGMGSAGCVTGVGTFLKQEKPSVTVVGVCNKASDAIPGPRPYHLLDNIAFGWKDVTDSIMEIESIQAYRLSMVLSREGLICGPSSGMALKGLLEFIQKQKDSGRLNHYRESETGEVACVFLCCDLPYQYMDTYFKKLGADDFHAITNASLRDTDQGQYDPRWELTPTEAARLDRGTMFKLCTMPVASHALQNSHGCGSLSTSFKILDLRRSEDFSRSHISGSLSKAISSLEPDTESPFDSVPVLEAQFKSLVKLTSELRSNGHFCKHDTVLVLCYDGETSRLSCSILRQEGIKAFSVRGGFQTLANQLFVSA
ncbi:cysteine synthase-like protein B [Penicillium malachiteum]|uniref:cysteine synthase-like protein B n=1 Tax=Penicillium malachiteum TaxID=1324776 RepID=UPI002548BBED|nr:cysteine synthase-like protein B [Penicillium malachiteum]KAJ5714407.1 cysteine synthase-like protein B [Penicillium malachiteum]